MSTATLQQPTLVQDVKLISPVNTHVSHYNKAAYISLALVLLFVLYVFLPHPTFLRPILNFSVFYILIVPLAAFILSIFAIKHAARSEEAEKGTAFGYVALSVTTLYFMTALAIPVVLIGCYLLYSYII